MERWRSGARLRVSLIPQDLLEELVDLGCSRNAPHPEDHAGCEPLSVWELSRTESSTEVVSTLLRSTACTQPTSINWIPKHDYLELLQASCIPALDGLLSSSSTRSSTLTVGMCHAAIARVNLTTGLGGLQASFTQARNTLSKEGENPTVKYAIGVAQKVEKQVAVWIGFLDLLGSEHQISDSECVRGVEILVLRLMERANAALMALQSITV